MKSLLLSILILMTGVIGATEEPTWVNTPFELDLWNSVVVPSGRAAEVTQAEFELIKAADGDVSIPIGDEPASALADFGDLDGWKNYAEFSFGSDYLKETEVPYDGRAKTAWKQWKVRKKAPYNPAAPVFELKMKHNVNLPASYLHIEFEVLLYNQSTGKMEAVRVPQGDVTFAQQYSIPPGPDPNTDMDEFVYSIDLSNSISSLEIPYRSTIGNQSGEPRGDMLRIRSFIVLSEEPT